MELFTKEIEGKSVVRPLREIVVRRNGMCTYNPSKEAVLSDGWVPYVLPEPEPEEVDLLEQAIRQKIEELREFDESKEVNNCIIVSNGIEMNYWKNKHERDALKSAVRDYQTIGRTDYRLDLRELGVYLWIPCDKLLQMLAELEVYATDCFNRTTDHMFAIKGLASVEEVEAYDFREGYPAVVRFGF